MLAFVASMFALGLVTSVHCVSMCGPLILTYAVSGSADGPWYRRLVPHLTYHGARFLSYSLIGLLLGAVGSALDFDVIRPYALFVAGALMVVLGLGMTGRVRWARYLTPRPPRFLVAAIRNTRRKAVVDAAEGAESLATPVIFGLLTGILPCGPAIAAELASATSGSAAAGALGMLAFGVGTAPLLLVFGASASMIPRRFKERLNLVLALSVMVWGAVFLNQALMLSGSPVTFATARQAVLGGPAADPQAAVWTAANDGVVEVLVATKSKEFIPREVRIPAGRPVRLIFDRRGDTECANSKQVEIPRLHLLVSAAALTTTAVDVPPTAAGSYTMTCAMGLMEGAIIVVPDSSANGGPR